MMRPSSRQGAPAEEPSDSVLLDRVAHGDLGGLGSLYDRHAPALLAFLHRAAGGGEAEDLLQSTFLRAMDAAGRFEKTAASARPWLFGIAVRLLAERRRSLRRLGSVVAQLLAQQPRPAELSRPGEAADLNRALARLSEPKRVVLLLCEVEGFTAPESAVILGIPVGTVWTRLHHARRELRELLGGMP